MNAETRLLITGSSGLIGTHLVAEAQRRGWTVCGTDVASPRDPDHAAHLKRADLMDPEALSRVLNDFAPSHVVHLGARTDLLGEALMDYDVNITGTRNLIKAIDQTPSVKRTVYTSTQLVCRVGYIPEHDEDFAPCNLYGESKVAMEQLVRAEANGEWCLTRPTTIWGPGMSPHYQRFLRMLRRGMYVHVGNDRRLKTYGYVGNTCHQILGLLDAPADAIQGQTFYLADYDPTSLRDWADGLAMALDGPRVRTVPAGVAKLAAAVGDGLVRVGLRSFPFTSFRLRNVMTDSVMDMSHTQKVIPELPWTVDDGVRETARWFLDLEGRTL